jgi:hypothetical protein
MRSTAPGVIMFTLCTPSSTHIRRRVVPGSTPARRSSGAGRKGPRNHGVPADHRRGPAQRALHPKQTSPSWRWPRTRLRRRARWAMAVRIACLNQPHSRSPHPATGRRSMRAPCLSARRKRPIRWPLQRSRAQHASRAHPSASDATAAASSPACSMARTRRSAVRPAYLGRDPAACLDSRGAQRLGVRTRRAWCERVRDGSDRGWRCRGGGDAVPGSAESARIASSPPGRALLRGVPRRQRRVRHPRPHQPTGVNGWPAWSSDGTRIAFASNRRGNSTRSSR